MTLLNKNYQNQLKHNYLLFLSLVFVMLASYSVIKSSKYITLTPIIDFPQKVQEKVITIVITPALTPVIKKVVKKRVVKKKIIKRVESVKTIAVIEPVVEQLEEPIVEPVIETLLVEQVTPKVIEKPIFDAQMKSSFIAGLYEMLEKEKYYPKMAKRRKLEGVVEISFTLRKDGQIKDVFVHKDCKHSMLNKAALKVVKSIDTYKPIPDAVSMASLNLNIPIKYSRR